MYVCMYVCMFSALNIYSRLKVQVPGLQPVIQKNLNFHKRKERDMGTVVVQFDLSGIMSNTKDSTAP